MPRGDMNGEISIEQMADNAAVEKSSAAEYSHASRRHNPKVPRRLPLGYSALQTTSPWRASV